MILDEKIAEKVTDILLNINAVKLNKKNPFIWASGIKSPIYCDNRILLSNPTYRLKIANYFGDLILKNHPHVEVIAGVATGAIGIGLLVAEVLQLPFVYIRSDIKKHGRKNLIEGHLETNKKIIVIEDLISTGKSSINAVNTLYSQNQNVLALYAIFSYELKIAKDNFEEIQLPYYTLSNYSSLLTKAVDTNYILASDLKELKNWQTSPENWK